MRTRSRIPAPAAVPAVPALVRWRGRRLYDPRPIPLHSLQLVWMSGGVVLTLLVNLWMLGRLPMPWRTRRVVEIAGAAAAAATLAVAVAGPFLAVDGADALWGPVVLALIASRIAGLVLQLAFGPAVRRSYRHLEHWGGDTGARLAPAPVPALAGLVVDCALLVPVVLVVAAAAGLLS